MIRDDSGVIEHRYDTKENWTAANPVLARGELGIETELGVARLKVGDGTTHWNDLEYITDSKDSVGSDIGVAEIEKMINRAKEEALDKIAAAQSNALISFGSLMQKAELAADTAAEKMLTAVLQKRNQWLIVSL